MADAEGGILIRGGRIVDPASGLDGEGDLYVAGGLVRGIGAAATALGRESRARVVDASGCAVVPGLIDLHVHFREPGACHKEDIASGSLAAAKGGYTTVCCMPNTDPAIDGPETLAFVDRRGREAGRVNLLAAGAMTRGQAGAELSDIDGMCALRTRCGELAGRGICALTEDGKTLMDPALMRRLAEKAAGLGLPVMDHAESRAVSGLAASGGPASAGSWPAGACPKAEADIVARDIRLAAETGCRMHIQHVSAKESVALLREARARGRGISAETAPHYLALTEDALRLHGADAKMNPPLRGEADRQAVLEGIADGSIGLIATDHAPHAEEEKARGIESAPFGVTGLETGFAVSYTVLVMGGVVTLAGLIRLMSASPAALAGLPRGRIAVGDAADIAVIDIGRPYRIDRDTFVSKGKNTPFHGMRVYGRTRCTILGGRMVWEDDR
ncbi:MAG: dihydroorotase [Clostridiales Family XIII bacterium]|jgi:dihydroorotase|nr:dihydroorotase [Clostridiales Family XIII bacterium]